MENKAIVLIHCFDQKGLVVAITDFIHGNGGNIIELEQYVDIQNKVFFMRIEWDLTDFVIPADKLYDYFDTLIAKKYNMKFRLYLSENIPRMAIFVSNMSHCLYDILARAQSKEWRMEIPLIISNHDVLEPVAKRFGIDFHVLPINKDNKAEQEKKQLELLEKYNINFIVLARYMQILSGEFISHYTNKIINIHHSFLPAFPGAKPYHSAHQRGVKMIGATSHYVTDDLDAGPIIEQDIAKVTHKETIKDLIRQGKDIEKLVLSRAIWHHINRKLLVYNNKTIVFN